MSILDRLERKLGRYAVPNLMKYICAMYALGFLIQITAPEFYFYYLDLDPEAILHGHIWRILSFLIYYPAANGFGSIFWAIIGIMVYYSIGKTLEYLWGNFRYNFFFFSGVILYNVAGILIYLLTGVSLQLNPTYMGFSIFLAYALTLPDTVFYLYFLAVSQSPGEKLSIVLSFANVMLFFILLNQGRRKNIFNIKNYR